MLRGGIPGRLFRWITSYFHPNRINGEDDDDSDNTEEGEEEESGQVLEGENQEESLMRKRKKTSKKLKENQRRQQIVNFDQSLPGTHSYLGNDLEDVRGRTILEEDTVISLPLLCQYSVVLVPGQVIPLQLYIQNQVAMIRQVSAGNKTFGIVNIGLNRDTSEQYVSDIGCTAEIFSMKDDMDEASGISIVRVKARGRQRFRVLKTQVEITGEIMAQVKILPEVSTKHLLDEVCLPSHRRLCVKPPASAEDVKTAVDQSGNVIATVNCGKQYILNKFYSSRLTPWPSWVYKMYDINWLSEQIRSELGSWSTSPLPSEPVDLSFWVAHNLPVDDLIRIQLLALDSVVQRLRFGLSIIRKSGFTLNCDMCDCNIANRKDVFSMSREGPLGAYVNPGGHVHEMFTVLSAKGLRNIGGASTEHSWFPGYAWTIVQCKDCHEHMGWMFTAAKKNLSPKKFWGLCRSSVRTAISGTSEEEDGQKNIIVM